MPCCSEWPTIPQVYVKGEFVGGADILYSSKSPRCFLVVSRPFRSIRGNDPLMACSVHKSGELEKLLVKEGFIPELPDLPEDQKSAS